MKTKDGKIVYEYIISKEEIYELRNQGLSDNEIIAFFDDIITRYDNPEYIDNFAGELL